MNLSPTDVPVTDQKSLAAYIRNLIAEIDILSDRVLEKLDSPEEDSKRVPFYFCQPASFMPYDMTLKETTFVNGAEDVSILAMTYAVESSAPVTGAGLSPPTPAGVTPYNNVVSNTNDAVILLSQPVTTDGIPRTFSFDFQWNFRTKTGMPYNSAGAIGAGPANTFLLPRTALGFPEQGDILRFDRPQVLRAGESLIFTVKPTLWASRDARNSGAFNPYNNNTRVTVNMIGIGFRDGRMAWPTVRS